MGHINAVLPHRRTGFMMIINVHSAVVFAADPRGIEILSETIRVSHAWAIDSAVNCPARQDALQNTFKIRIHSGSPYL